MSRRYLLDTPRGERSLVAELLDEAGWQRTEQENWNLRWSSSLPALRVFRALRPGRFLNHWPGIAAITRKDTLSWTLALAGLDAPSRYRFHAQTFVMPEDHGAFLEAAAKSPRALWIRKPVASSNGRGISLVKDPAKVSQRRGFLVQRYLDQPHLLDGHKYTLRLYVALTGVDPLAVWLFEDGFTKLATRRFSTSREALGDRTVHLTNPEVQEKNHEVPVSSMNMTHRQYRARLRAAGIDDEALWGRIRALVLATMEAARPFVVEAAARALPVRHGTPFELLGLDVLVDRRLKPWLVECNLGPSLSVEAAPSTENARSEYAIKRQVVGDLLRLVGLLPEGGRSGFERIC